MSKDDMCDLESQRDELSNLAPKDRRYGWNVVTRQDILSAVMAKYFGTVRSPVGCVFEGKTVPEDHAQVAFSSIWDGEYRSVYQDWKTGKLTTSNYVLPCFERPFDCESDAYLKPFQCHRCNWPLTSDPLGSASQAPKLGVCLEAQVVFNSKEAFSGSDWHIGLVGKFIAPTAQFVRRTDQSRVSACGQPARKETNPPIR